MKLELFIEKFKAQFIDADEITVAAETKFRDLPTWDSLTGMAVLVMIQDDFNTEVTDSELQSVNTVQELYSLIDRKRNA